MDKETLQQIEQITGYHFSNSNLLDKAFTHASATDNRGLSNERLEFFGDAILGMVICHILFEQFPDYFEGDLTKIKSMLVSRRTCAKITKELGLHNFLNVGKGMLRNSAITGSIAAGLLEAIIAVIYIDGGFEASRSFILRIFAALLENVDAKHSQGNYKSLLQQYAQQQLNTTPAYELLDEKGPDHNKCFEVQVIIAERIFTSAWGTNKKRAEQKAAYNALVELNITTDKLSDID